jgi:hypothetical protein
MEASMKLVSNGYVVKGLGIKNSLFDSDNYKGIAKYISWPLKKLDDNTSNNLENECWERWFSFHDVYDLVPERDFLKRYIKHCNSCNIKTQILQVQTQNKNQIASDILRVSSILGFDCIAGTDLSYLCMPSENIKEYFGSIYNKLNPNGLFNTIDDAYQFLEIYNRLLSEGINLEDWGNPVPAKISLVSL